MTSIDSISRAVLVLIRTGAVCRIAYCFLRLITADEEAVQYKRRIRNTIAFYVLAELAFVIKDLFIRYYS